MIYRVQTPAQLGLLEAEMRPGIAVILRDTGFDKTVDQVWDELHEHLTDPASKGLWVALDAGRLVVWAACKVYSDEGRLSGCITWAWASPKAGQQNRAVMDAMIAFAKGAGCQGLYCSRVTRLKGFARRMKQYGFKFHAAIFALEWPVKVEAEEVDHRQQTGPKRPFDHEPAARDPAPLAAADRPHHAGTDGPAGATAEHGDQPAAPAGGVEPATRHGERDAGHGAAGAADAPDARAP